ncbi:MAG: carboxy terminal-processing peptidase [Saprospiraceae bacterium]|nr:carboxy terminal-processing peptidase [Saprospiraceae bacterium]
MRYPTSSYTMKAGKPFFFSLIALVAAIAAFYPPERPGTRDQIQLATMMEGLRQYHFMPKEVDDNFSDQVYKEYLDRLDSGKRFFTQSDVETLNAFKLDIDDQINQRSFEFFNAASDRYAAAIDRTEGWFREILSKPFNFEIDEHLETDTEKLAWAKDENELKDRWRQQLKYEVLSRLADKIEDRNKGVEELQEKSMEDLEADSREAVLERYQDWYERLQKTKNSEFFSEYLSTIANLYDPHSEYFEPVEKENFDITMAGKLEGIGARLQTEKDNTKVMSIITGGPAWKQKELEVNDVILKVAQGEGEAEVVTGLDINDVVSKIRGDKGTIVKLTVRKADGSIKEIAITRDEVVLDEGFAKSVILSDASANDRIGYIRLPRFYADFESSEGRSCAVDMAREIDKLKNENVDGLIIDLRNNGGGSLRDVVTMSGYFIEKGPIVQVKSKSGRASVHEDRDPTVQWDGPVIIMVNEFSASASEIMAAALQDYERAVIVGSPSTFGKGTVQRFFDMDNAVSGNDDIKPLGQVKLTIQKFYRIDGGSTQLKGVVPDIILPDNYAKLDFGEKENPYSMPWTEIEPVAHQQKVYRVDGYMSKLRAFSQERVNKSATFQLTEQNANRFKAQRDQTTYPLKLDYFQAYVKEKKDEADRYKDNYTPDESLVVTNPAVDLPRIQQDSAKIASNDDFLDQVKKDAYIDETLNIMADMLRLDAEYARNTGQEVIKER